MKLIKIIKQLLEDNNENSQDNYYRQLLDLIQKRIDTSTNNEDKNTYIKMYKNIEQEWKEKKETNIRDEERKKEVASGKLNIIKSYPKEAEQLDVISVPKTIKNWVKENNSNKIGKFFIIRETNNLEFIENIGSLTKETAQFFELALDKNGNVVPKPIGKLSSRRGVDDDDTEGPFIIKGKFSIPSGKILVVSYYISYGNYVLTYIYTANDFFKKIGTEDSSKKLDK